METPHQGNASPFTGAGEPRSGDIAITVLTAFILLVVLVVVAILA